MRFIKDVVVIVTAIPFIGIMWLWSLVSGEKAE